MGEQAIPTIFIQNLPAVISPNDLIYSIESVSQPQMFKILSVSYNNEKYFLRSMYLSFSSIQDFNSYIGGALTLKYQNTILEGEILDDDPFYLKALVVMNLNKNYSEYHILSHFAQFRAESVKIYPSMSGNTNCAVVIFNRARDRDAAFIRCEKMHNTVFYLFPSVDQVTTVLDPPNTKYDPRPPLPTIILPTDFVFVHGNTQYICHAKNVRSVCKRDFPQNYIVIPDYRGNFKDVQRFIDGEKIDVNESNVTFLFNVGAFLLIPALSKLNPFVYLTMNNVIAMANDMKDLVDIVSLMRFITKNLEMLTKSQRLRLLPVKVITQCIDSPAQLSIQIDPCQLLMQLPSDTPNQTPLAALIQYKTLDIPELKVILQNENINLNKIHDNFLPGYHHVADAPPYVVCEFVDGFPFNGIFAYLTELKHMNPHQAGVVTLEASSTQISTISRILDYSSNDYFATRDVPGQWIKFEFNAYRVSLSGYSYKTHSINGNGHTKTWKVEGSVDGVNWNLIHEMVNSNVLSTYGAVYTAQFQATQFYKVIKFTQTGTNTMHYHNFRVANIEFFGKIQDE